MVLEGAMSVPFDQFFILLFNHNKVVIPTPVIMKNCQKWS